MTYLVRCLVGAGEPASALFDLQAGVSIIPTIAAWQKHLPATTAWLHYRRHQHAGPKHKLLLQAVCLCHLACVSTVIDTLAASKEGWCSTETMHLAKSCAPKIIWREAGATRVVERFAKEQLNSIGAKFSFVAQGGRSHAPTDVLDSALLPVHSALRSALTDYRVHSPQETHTRGVA